MALNPLTTIDLWEAMRFTDLSATAKRVLTADWINRGYSPSTVPGLSDMEAARMRKIMTEEGMETIQDALLYITELEAEVRRLRGQLQVASRR